MAQKRRIEVFTAGCPLCDKAVELVKKMACESCEVTVYDIREQCDEKVCMDKVKEYGITSVPTVVINGQIADCCKRGEVSADLIRSAGVGRPLYNS